MSSLGINARTGKVLTGWEHTQQSIDKILHTPIGSRVMRREFGSEVPDLVDRKMVASNILAVYVAAAVAIAKWEPRYRVTAAQVTEVEATGKITLWLGGTYYPNGHKGDFRTSEKRDTVVTYD